MPNDPKEIESIYIIFGNHIKEARERMGFSQEQLGELLNLTRVSIANIESGRQRVLFHTGISLIKLFKIDLNKLCDESLEIKFKWK